MLAVTIAWAVCLLYLGLAPRLPEVGSFDENTVASWGHALGTMVLAALLYLLVVGSGRAPRTRTAVAVVLAASLFGVGIELLQSLTGHRDPSVGDALLDAAGAAVGVAFLSRPRVSIPAWSQAMTWTAAVLLVTLVPATILVRPEPERECSVSRAPRLTPSQNPSEEAVEPHPIASYRFAEGDGHQVADISGVAPALDLELVGSGVQWLDEGGLRFVDGAARSTAPATKLVDAIRRTGELAIEAWIRSDELDQDEPARIATISEGTERDEVDVHVGQEARGLSVRIRATCGDFNRTTVADVFTSRTELVHVAVTFAERTRRVYVEGKEVAAGVFDGRLGAWDRTFPLVVGNEATLDRPFRGDVFALAVYDQALSPATIAQHAAAGAASLHPDET
jgi:VanZ family protein